MEETVPPEPESIYAREGTLAHELGELKASLAFGHITRRQYDSRYRKWVTANNDVLTDDVIDEMHLHTDAYVALIQERAELYPNSQVLLEQRMDTGVPTCWGTSDTVIASPRHVEIIDLKYGAGVAVEAEGNPQLRLYACGAMDTFGDLLGETEIIRVTVYQPRMDHVLTEEITPAELRRWRDEEVIPIAQLALGDDAPFGPSDTACRWCPASGRCKAQLEAVFATDFEEDPGTLSPDEVSEKLGQVKMIRDWLNAFEMAALNMAYSEGITIPGYKVVLSGGQRSVRDSEAAIAALRDAGYEDDEIVNVKPKGIGDLEKLLGKELFAQLLETPGIVTKSEGKPALVDESDRRSSITPNNEAAKVFGEDLL
jgi:uncharacterized protein CbrC (UPF0167 family)